MLNSVKFMKRLGLSLPLIQAPMANVSTPQLALEVLRAGALGSLALSPIDLMSSPSKVFEEVQKFRDGCEETSVVNCNFFCFDPAEQHAPSLTEAANWHTLLGAATNIPENEVKAKVSEIKRAVVSFLEFERTNPAGLDKFIDRLVTENVGVVSFHFGVPSTETISKFRQGGILVFGCVTSLDEAKLCVKLGVDALVCQGYEAGGHRGNFLAKDCLDENLSTEALFQRVISYTNKLEHAPFVIPAGGVMKKAQFEDYLAKGAAAVQIGTAFIPATESAAPLFIADAAKKEDYLPTHMTKLVSGRNARTLMTPFIRALTEKQAESNFDLPLFGYSTYAYRLLTKGNLSFGFYLAGQNYPMLDGERSAREIVESFK